MLRELPRQLRLCLKLRLGKSGHTVHTVGLQLPKETTGKRSAETDK